MAGDGLSRNRKMLLPQKDAKSEKYFSSWRPLRFLAAILFWSILAPAFAEPIVATFSVVGFDPATGDLGVAVESKFFSVGSVVPWAKAKVGAVATQARANVAFGQVGLDMLEAGKSPAAIVKTFSRADTNIAERQFAIIDARGRVAAHTGTNCLDWAGHRLGTNFSVQGNILTGPEVIDAMATAYRLSQRIEGTELADWLMAAMEAGQQAGGDKRGRQSAALLVVRERGNFTGQTDRYIDLRVEDHPEPIEELARLLKLHREFFGRSKPPAREK